MQGQDGWNYGYRSYTDDGSTTETCDVGVSPAGDFILFAGGSATVGATPWNQANIIADTQHWNPAANTGWDLSASNAPWTSMYREAVHPNGTNSTTTIYTADSAREHWVIRRWSASAETAPPIAAPTPVALIYRTTRTAVGTGVTSALYINAVLKDSVILPGTNGFSVTRKFFVMLDPADKVDLVLTPVGIGGNRTDNSDRGHQYQAGRYRRRRTHRRRGSERSRHLQSHPHRHRWRWIE